jgi:UDP-N-acetylmuramoyl-tripeptide--D-alanyl-D-alanine ligase
MRGSHWAMNVMAVLAALDALGLDARKAAGYLHDFNELPGRGAVSKGRFADVGITLIDDSYNAGPASMKAAFATIADTPPQIMVLSDMLELGEGAAAAHAALAPAITALRPRVLITIGAMMADMASLLPGSIEHHAAGAPAEASTALRAALHDGDRVFIKGSNGSGAWRVAAEILDGLAAHPDTNGGTSHAA